MKLIKKKPTTPSQRHLIILKNFTLNKKTKLKTEIKKIKNNAGRNNSGKITIRHRGGGHKKRYRKLDLFRKTNTTGLITGIEYDPNRTANIATVFDIQKKKFFYILAPKNIETGDIIRSGSRAGLGLGHSLPISKIPVGSHIHNVCLHPNQIGKISRAAGTYSKLINLDNGVAKIKMSSKKTINVSDKCIATIGIVSNQLKFLTTLGKAGRARWLGKRPEVRGVAMNPVDHPHGGGEGKKSGKGKTPWGRKVK